MLAVLCLVATAVLSGTVWQERPPAKADSPAAALNHCVKTLSDEAEKSKSQGALVRTSRTFAKECGEQLPTELLLERITRRVDSDDFTDAYVRWQLTGFELNAFAMTDRAFERMLQTLPSFVENPRADAGLIELLNKVAQAGQLSETQQAEINARLNDLASRSSAAESLNVPASEFREWLVERFAAEPHRSLALLLERAASRSAAGWPIDDDKQQIDKAVEKAAGQREFTIDQRRDFLRDAEKCVTTGRLAVASAGIGGGALGVQYMTTGIFDFDVRRWEKALREP